jgi:hypothetical protein
MVRLPVLSVSSPQNFHTPTTAIARVTTGHSTTITLCIHRIGEPQSRRTLASRSAHRPFERRDSKSIVLVQMPREFLDGHTGERHGRNQGVATDAVVSDSSSETRHDVRQPRLRRQAGTATTHRAPPPSSPDHASALGILVGEMSSVRSVRLKGLSELTRHTAATVALATSNARRETLEQRWRSAQGGRVPVRAAQAQC